MAYDALEAIVCELLLRGPFVFTEDNVLDKSRQSESLGVGHILESSAYSPHSTCFLNAIYPRLALVIRGRCVVMAPSGRRKLITFRDQLISKSNVKAHENVVKYVGTASPLRYADNPSHSRVENR